MPDSTAQIPLPPSCTPSPLQEPAPTATPFIFPDLLAPLVRPVEPWELDEEDVQEVNQSWPSCTSLVSFERHSNLRECKERIIQILKLGTKLGYGLHSAQILTHNQYTKTFGKESTMLDDLLKHVLACGTITKETAYRL